MSYTNYLWLVFGLIQISGCEGVLSFKKAPENSTTDAGGAFRVGERRRDGRMVQGDAAIKPDDDGSTTQNTAAKCKASTAYLHVNAWPFLYSFREQCDKEYKRVWRCKRYGYCKEETNQGPVDRSLAELKQQRDRCDLCDRTPGGQENGSCDRSCPSRCRHATGDRGLNHSLASNCRDTIAIDPNDEDDVCHEGPDPRNYRYDELQGYFYGSPYSFIGEYLVHLIDAGGSIFRSFHDPEVSGNASGSVAVVGCDSMANRCNNLYGSGGTTRSRVWPIRPSDSWGFISCIEVPVGQKIEVAIQGEVWKDTSDKGNKTDLSPKWTTRFNFTPQAGRHYFLNGAGINEWNAWDKGDCVGPPDEIHSRLAHLYSRMNQSVSVEQARQAIQCSTLR